MRVLRPSVMRVDGTDGNVAAVTFPVCAQTLLEFFRQLVADGTHLFDFVVGQEVGFAFLAVARVDGVAEEDDLGVVDAFLMFPVKHVWAWERTACTVAPFEESAHAGGEAVAHVVCDERFELVPFAFAVAFGVGIVEPKGLGDVGSGDADDGSAVEADVIIPFEEIDDAPVGSVEVFDVLDFLVFVEEFHDVSPFSMCVHPAHASPRIAFSHE